MTGSFLLTQIERARYLIGGKEAGASFHARWHEPEHRGLPADGSAQLAWDRAVILNADLTFPVTAIED
jgi:hypothetical protein